MIAAIRNRLTDWMAQPREPEAGAIVLVQRRIFILPTRSGIVFAVVLLMMLLGSINYTLSLGFVLTFLLVAMVFNATLHTFRNLSQLSVTPGRVRAVFAGEHAQFSINVVNPGRLDRYSIGIARAGRAQDGDDYADIPAGQTATLKVSIPAEKRGVLACGRLTLFTRYPLGLYYAWSYVHPDMRCIIYPRPTPPGLPLPSAEATRGNGATLGKGQEDFAGLRPYHLGDSSRHIAWKAAARGQGLLTKQFSGQAASEIWLGWDMLPARMSVEEKLSRLTRWVLDAHAQGVVYGLRLPGITIDMAMDEAHRDRCLEALALFNLDAPAETHHDTRHQPA